MQSPETEALLVELHERSSIVAELDGPQIEAWVSGLFELFGHDCTAEQFVSYCAANPSPETTLVCAAIGELSTGIDDDLALHARKLAPETSRPELGDTQHRLMQIGRSELVRAWTVEAPFGRSVVLGFDNAVVGAEAADSDPQDLRHSILIELGDDDTVQDLQLAGPPQHLIEEAAAENDRVVVREIDTQKAANLVCDAWPDGARSDGAPELGPGLASNQRFVRRRILDATGRLLPEIAIPAHPVDIQRGLSDSDFQDANRAAFSTLQAAVGQIEEVAEGATAERRAWVGVVRGDGGEVSPRERDGLLWLEWADWLGAGIGLLRAGAGTAVDGASLVDAVNRCPEVSSTIDKADRDYAEWAFEVAIDLLGDAGVVVDGELTEAGYDALGPALVAAWQPVEPG